LSDLNGKGIDRSTNYLEKVAGFNLRKTSEEWNQIKKIQKIRNVIVHQDGRLIDRQGSPIKATIDYVNQMDSLTGDTEIIIKEGFLQHAVNTFKKYFRLIGESIEKAEGT